MLFVMDVYLCFIVMVDFRIECGYIFCVVVHYMMRARIAARMRIFKRVKSSICVVVVVGKQGPRPSSPFFEICVHVCVGTLPGTRPMPRLESQK